VVQGACWGKGGVGGSKGGTIRSMWRFEWIREEDITDKKRIEGEIVKDIKRQYIIGGFYGCQLSGTGANGVKNLCHRIPPLQSTKNNYRGSKINYYGS
jgi:hypothetical protein